LIHPVRKSVCLLILLIGLSTFVARAQLGFCDGNSGDPIFTEDFGSGIMNGPALPTGTTSYTYINGTPNDGLYTISSNTAYFDWFDINDHTPNDSSGKAFIVNASFTPGEFYRREVNGLCENTSYEFSSWLTNLLPTSSCNGNGIPINVKFQIWDSTDTNLLASGDTGSIFSKSAPDWEQYALLFQTLPNQTSVILKMLNNGAGGCGNDLAIDDIVFKTCGDYIEIIDDLNQNNILVCEDEGPINTALTAVPDFSIYTTHVYQWQQSNDGITWMDIVGENNQSYTPPTINEPTFFRVKVAEDVVNLTNDLCNVLSDVFDIIIVPKPNPPASGSPSATLCPNQNEAIFVTVPDNVMVNWYDSPSGGNLLLENSVAFIPEVPGTYYAEANSNMVNCPSDSRIAISVDFYSPPMPTDESLTFCEGSSIILSAGIPNMAYLWSTSEASFEIEVNTPGEYTVEITNANSCSALKTIVLTQLETPIIERIDSDDYTLEVITSNHGDFEYSINGGYFQDSPIFPNTPGGPYTVYVRERNGCGTVPISYIHLVIPKFFTPNGDRINDEFVPEGIDAFPNYEVQVFNRYGTLLKHMKNETFAWDGTFNNKELPASDYWYSIKIDTTIFKGHFSLKR